MKQRISSFEPQPFEQAHIDTVRQLAPECMVLLKNDGTLPLSQVGPLALYGNGARQTLKGGSGSGDVNVRHFVSVEEGLENAGFQITTKKWLNSYEQLINKVQQDYSASLEKEAKQKGIDPTFFLLGKKASEPEYNFPLDGAGDTAVYVLARSSGEGTDRKPQAGDINLTTTEIRDILSLNHKYKHFILVLNVGGLVDLSPVQEVQTILLLGQLGTPTGDALADVLLGKSYPSGKLTMTWAPINSYPSTKGFGAADETNYREGIYVGYRYFDSVQATVTYPFGFGLGFTSFQIHVDQISVNKDIISVDVSVLNSGAKPGKEVVQVYYSAPQGQLDKPYQELAAFAKTPELQGGQSTKLHLEYNLRQMASYDSQNNNWLLEKGKYLIRVGNSSQNTTIAGVVILDENIIIEHDLQIKGTDHFSDWKPEINNMTTATSNLDCPTFTIKNINLNKKTAAAAHIPAATTPHSAATWADLKQKRVTLEEFVGGLSDEELIQICLGAYKENHSQSALDVIGNASSQVAGAAGETTHALQHLGVPALVMADGPAGLRLSPQYSMTKNNAQSITTDSPVKADKKQPVYYQYCIAIPIGTDIAQSWNEQLAETCGNIVGQEMEIFGIDIWLAPALNIQRSPLCGRNFEYFSEDPYVSGIMAAAITQGVQKHPHKATTIKHFACNNQETNRFFSNSNVSVRALREIYLKGFEICIKKSQPHFLMTSYNLVNGEHSSNRRDLLTNVVRQEWGFQGVIMTDWLATGGTGEKSTKWPSASAAGDVKAGNDLTMPGTAADKEDLVQALNNENHPYSLNRAYLQQSAQRVLAMIYQLTA